MQIAFHAAPYTLRRRDEIVSKGVVVQYSGASGLYQHHPASPGVPSGELHHDYERGLEKLAPHKPVQQYRHNVGEDYGDAHLKRQIMGREVVVAITDGCLDFGPWEQIFYSEFDGGRKKRVLVKIIGE